MSMVLWRSTALVNQTTLTGESLTVERSVEDSVYAGTTVESGEIFIRVIQNTASTKVSSIVSMVETSEQLKSST